MAITKSHSPPIWLGVIAILLVLAIVGYVIVSELGLNLNIGYNTNEGFHSGGPRQYLGGFWHDHYPYPPHGYFYNRYPYPPPNPYLYPSSYSPYASPYHPYGYYGRSYDSMYYGGMPRYIPYDPLDARLPVPMDGHTTAYYYDRYKRHADENKAANPYKYHYDAEGELIDSEDAKYYDHQPWNQSTSPRSWWSGWIW